MQLPCERLVGRQAHLACGTGGGGAAAMVTGGASSRAAGTLPSTRPCLQLHSHAGLLLPPPHTHDTRFAVPPLAHRQRARHPPLLLATKRGAPLLSKNVLRREALASMGEGGRPITSMMQASCSVSSSPAEEKGGGDVHNVPKQLFRHFVLVCEARVGREGRAAGRWCGHEPCTMTLQSNLLREAGPCPALPRPPGNSG